MASLVNLFRSSARHSSRLRSTLPTATGVARSRGIITSPPEAQGLGDASADLDNITRTFEEAEEGVHTAKQPFFKPFYPHYFTKPSDFSKEARLETGAFRRSKRPYLGPGRAEAEAQDVFRQLNIDPLQEATNSRLLSAFVTDMGKIKQRPVTNLTWRSQRKLGKAVRRARMMGIIPQLSKKMLSQSYTPGMVRPSMK